MGSAFASGGNRMDIATINTHEHGPDVMRRVMEGEPAARQSTRPAEWDGPLKPQALATLLRLVSDVTRLKLLFLLVDRERSVTELYKELSLPQPSVSHHLSWLRAADLVVSRRAGKSVIYALGPRVARDGDWLAIGSLRFRLDGGAA